MGGMTVPQFLGFTEICGIYVFLRLIFRSRNLTSQFKHSPNRWHTVCNVLNFFHNKSMVNVCKADSYIHTYYFFWKPVFNCYWSDLCLTISMTLYFYFLEFENSKTLIGPRWDEEGAASMSLEAHFPVALVYSKWSATLFLLLFLQITYYLNADCVYLKFVRYNLKDSNHQNTIHVRSYSYLILGVYTVYTVRSVNLILAHWSSYNLWSQKLYWNVTIFLKKTSYCTQTDLIRHKFCSVCLKPLLLVYAYWSKVH
jgi:hypothetical protein